MISPAKAPAANRSESPGRNGVRTRPVSQNTIANRMAYVSCPWVVIMPAMWWSKCRMKSTAAVKSSQKMEEWWGWKPSRKSLDEK